MFKSEKDLFMERLEFFSEYLTKKNVNSFLGRIFGVFEVET